MGNTSGFNNSGTSESYTKKRKRLMRTPTGWESPSEGATIFGIQVGPGERAPVRHPQGYGSAPANPYLAEPPITPGQVTGFGALQTPSTFTQRGPFPNMGIGTSRGPQYPKVVDKSRLLGALDINTAQPTTGAAKPPQVPPDIADVLAPERAAKWGGPIWKAPAQPTPAPPAQPTPAPPAQQTEKARPDPTVTLSFDDYIRYGDDPRYPKSLLDDEPKPETQLSLNAPTNAPLRAPTGGNLGANPMTPLAPNRGGAFAPGQDPANNPLPQSKLSAPSAPTATPQIATPKPMANAAGVQKPAGGVASQPQQTSRFRPAPPAQPQQSSQQFAAGANALAGSLEAGRLRNWLTDPNQGLYNANAPANLGNSVAPQAPGVDESLLARLPRRSNNPGTQMNMLAPLSANPQPGERQLAKERAYAKARGPMPNNPSVPMMGREAAIRRGMSPGDTEITIGGTTYQVPAPDQGPNPHVMGVPGRHAAGGSLAENEQFQAYQDRLQARRDMANKIKTDTAGLRAWGNRAPVNVGLQVGAMGRSSPIMAKTFGPGMGLAQAAMQQGYNGPDIEENARRRMLMYSSPAELNKYFTSQGMLKNDATRATNDTIRARAERKRAKGAVGLSEAQGRQIDANIKNIAIDNQFRQDELAARQKMHAAGLVPQQTSAEADMRRADAAVMQQENAGKLTSPDALDAAAQREARTSMGANFDLMPPQQQRTFMDWMMRGTTPGSGMPGGAPYEPTVLERQQQAAAQAPGIQAWLGQDPTGFSGDELINAIPDAEMDLGAQDAQQLMSYMENMGLEISDGEVQAALQQGDMQKLEALLEAKRKRSRRPFTLIGPGFGGPF